MKKTPQEKILGFIRDYLEQHQMPPTLREIQDHCGFSAIGSIQYHLKNLAAAGMLEIKPRLSRGIMLTARAVGIPIVGRVPAGPAQMAFENIEGYLSSTHAEEQRADGKFTPMEARGLFALRVKGDSMINAGIYEGDLVVVRPQSSAKHGDIVVARLNEDESTVKRLVRKPGVLELLPENPKYRPIPIDENTAIIGKVIRVVRHYD